MMFVTSHIRGSWLSAKATTPRFSPADPSCKVADISWAEADQATEAIRASTAAFPTWKRMPIPKRCDLVERMIRGMEEQSEALAEIIRLESGKTRAEARREVSASLAEARFQADFLAHSLVEGSAEAELRHEPLGTVLLMTPWNFPLTTVVRKAVPALLCGNTAVIKRSPQGSATAAAFVKIACDAGLPAGVLNLVLTESGDVINAMIDHPDLKALSFTGSTGVGLRIAERLGSRDVRYQAEMGGCNAMVVWNDADLDQAATAATASGYAVCGQWCTGLSRLLVHSDVHDAFLQKLHQAVSSIRPEFGHDESSPLMGSLTTSRQLDRTREIIADAQRQGAKALVCDDEWPPSDGWHHPPVVLHDVTPEMACAREEMFAPIVALIRFGDIDEAIRIVNDSRYGLSFSVYTRDADVADQFINEVEAGVCHVNCETWHRTPDLPVCGWKDSGRGIAESGRTMRDFFTRIKVIYRRSSP
jgi:aldehyde dehydrogenase (NAD+)